MKRAVWCMLISLIVSGNSMMLWAEDFSLEGQWKVRLDAEDKGTGDKWYQSGFNDSVNIELPGTLDEAKIGYKLDVENMNYGVAFEDSDWPSRNVQERVDRSGHLVSEYMYIGKAWYQRKINIPAEWESKHIRLVLERVFWKSDVWIDGKYFGSNDSLVAEHWYDIGNFEAGEHLLTICVDNGLVHNIGIAGHAYGPETQSRWNGILGDIKLVATDAVFIRQLQVYPAKDRKSVKVKARLANMTDNDVEGNLLFKIVDDSRGAAGPISAMYTGIRLAPGENFIEDAVAVTSDVKAWDEFTPKLYSLKTSVEANGYKSTMREVFGFRSIERNGRSIKLNGKKIFLRGTLDCCVYPKTGYPPVTVAEWLRVLGIIKKYGFNHVRFHSWCPPEAAFEAADSLGMYLAPETSFWVDNWGTKEGTKPKLLGHDEQVLEYVWREMKRISDAYGNHPSFTFFCIGNEFGNKSDWEKINELVGRIKDHDGRRLYNGTTTRKLVDNDDYWVTAYTGTKKKYNSTRGVGPAHTNWDFSEAAAAVDLPVIVHETGQRVVFPDYDKLLGKFTGNLKPYNYTRLQKEFEKTGLSKYVPDFIKASANFQNILYKAEHEAFHRTKDYAGYQLLMLHDFPGQSEALVGVLDPFFESKGVISDEQVRKWNGPVVLLARFDKYVWSNNEVFSVKVGVSNYGSKDLNDSRVKWSLKTDDGIEVGSGASGPYDLPSGKLSEAGEIKVSLGSVKNASAMLLSVSVNGIQNDWKIWVYPSQITDPETEGVLIASEFGDDVQKALNDGKRVLFLAHSLKNEYTKQTKFLPVYWSAGWWGGRFSMLSITCTPEHKMLAEFPNDGYSDWQWYELLEKCRTFDLTDIAKGLDPIIQGVTDFHHNRLLGQVFEVKVGKGKLVVCGYDISNKPDQSPNVKQFRKSLLNYISSADFAPKYEMTFETAKKLLSR